MAIQMMHLGNALASFLQTVFKTYSKAAFGTPDKRGEVLDIGPTCRFYGKYLAKRFN